MLLKGDGFGLIRKQASVNLLADDHDAVTHLAGEGEGEGEAEAVGLRG